jgi:hypothetical protein
MNLDDLADLPEFVTPPAGAYRATLTSLEAKAIGNHSGVEIKITLNETLELADPTEAEVKPGTETSVSFLTDNEYGVGSFKAFLKPLADHFDTSSARETFEAAKGAEVMLVTKVRKGKKGTDAEDRRYLSIHKVEVL